MTRRFAQFSFCVMATFFAAAAHAITEAAPKLQPPHDELGPTFWEARGMILVLGNVAFFVALFLVYLLLRHPRKAAVISPYVVARRALEERRERPEDPQLLMEVSRILRRYATVVYVLPPDEFTTRELKFELDARPSADPRLAGELIGFLRQCDERKFSPEPLAASSGAVKTALELTEKLKVQHQPHAAPPVLEPGSPAPTPA